MSKVDQFGNIDKKSIDCNSGQKPSLRDKVTKGPILQEKKISEKNKISSTPQQSTGKAFGVNRILHTEDEPVEFRGNSF